VDSTDARADVEHRRSLDTLRANDVDELLGRRMKSTSPPAFEVLIGIQAVFPDQRQIVITAESPSRRLGHRQIVVVTSSA
jgi:hypothetical protein